jgi:hypothetical protein
LAQLHLAIAVILALMAMEGRFAFPAIRSLLLTAEVTVLLQVMPKEVWYGLWLFS